MGKRDDNSEDGHTWYLVQSKYGSSYKILEEGNKVITTLQGQNQSLSDSTRQLLEKLDVFRQQASDTDRIVLVFATPDPLNPQEREDLAKIKLIGRDRVRPNFDVEEVSLMTIWESLEETEQQRLSVDIKGQFVDQYSGLLVGTVSLIDLFKFLNLYQSKTGNLDQLYEKKCAQIFGQSPKNQQGHC